MSKPPKNLISNEHRSGGLTPLSEGMSPFVKKLLGKKGLIEMELIADWKNIVGEETATYTVPQKIDFKKDSRYNGVLHIAVPNGAFAIEIGQQKPVILEKINTYFGYQAVGNLKIMINDVFFKSAFETAKHDDKQQKNLVSQTQKSYIDQLTEGVNNPELKARLQKLGESILKNNV